jgi:hypothetical protein
LLYLKLTYLVSVTWWWLVSLGSPFTTSADVEPSKIGTATGDRSRAQARMYFHRIGAFPLCP